VSCAYHHNQLLRHLINPDTHSVKKFWCRIYGPSLVFFQGWCQAARYLARWRRSEGSSSTNQAPQCLRGCSWQLGIDRHCPRRVALATGISDELGYPLSRPVSLQKPPCARIKKAKWHLPPLCLENQEADNLTLRAAIATDLPWIRINVGKDKDHLRHVGICTNNSTSSRGSVNELTGRLASEGPQVQRASGIVGNHVVVHTNFWSRK
jgi:hypothetical protein